MSNGDSCSIPSASCHQSVILGRQERCFSLDGRRRTLDESCLPCLVPFGRSSAPPFSCTFVVPGRQSRPTGKMTRCLEACHIQACFGKNCFRALTADARNLVQLGNGFLIFAKVLADELVRLVNPLAHVINVVCDTQEKLLLERCQESNCVWFLVQNGNRRYGTTNHFMVYSF